MKINKNSKIFITGHKGMVGSAIHRLLKKKGFKSIITIEKKKLNLIYQNDVFKYLKKHKPDLVIVAAAKVGGILANSKYKSEFIYENLQIQNNLIHGSYLAGIKNLIFLGSSCIYPKSSKQPILEEYILTSPLEETNDTYAIAKIAGLMMCNNYSKDYNLNYKCLMPSNLYGPGDSYHTEHSHFFSALIKKIHSANRLNKKFITLWGSGKAKRELLFVDDLAEAVVYFINRRFKEQFINIGSGKDYQIEWYAKFIMNELGLKLKIKYDKTKPDGMKRKLLDSNLAKKYGWKYKTSLKNGFKKTYKDFLLKHI
jgi:GDP-L-fucose synthase